MKLTGCEEPVESKSIFLTTFKKLDAMKLRSITVGVLSAGLIGYSGVMGLSSVAAPSQFSGQENVGIDVFRSANPSVVTIRAGGASGSGSIVTTDGLVITNDHVVRGSNGQVRVITSDGKQYTGTVIATDRRNDLALIKLQTSDRLPAIRIASANNILVGQRVFALGSPFGRSGTLTTGILNRIGRDGNLQTDASLNPGNSGGPLLNSRGEMIGVNKAVVRPGFPGSSNIGIATSAIIANEFIQRNRNNSPADFRTARRPEPSRIPSFGAPSQRGGYRLGVTVDPETLIIEEVQPSSVASNSGLQPGDRLLALNGQRLFDVVQIVQFLEQRPSAAVITIARNRRLANLRVRF
jgi:serine protease Do